MYTEFYGLKKRPFAPSADPEFLYLSRVHELVCKNLEDSLQNRAGVMMLTGAVGAGKTTLLRYLCDKLRPSRDVALISGSKPDPQELLGMLIEAFKLSPPAGGKGVLVDILLEYFLKLSGNGNPCVIIIDEAESLPLKTFEELCVLSTFEMGSDSPVQTILAGQPQLRERLIHPSLAPLAQRVSIHHQLLSLSPDDVGNYVKHRLRAAGYDRREPLFTEAAAARVADISKGLPGAINVLCDASLGCASEEGATRVSDEIVEKAALKCGLQSALQPHEPPPAPAGALVGRDPVESVFAESSTEMSALEDEVTDIIEFAFADLPTEPGSSFSHLTDRLKALETRLDHLDTQCQDNALAVLQETFEKQRKRTSQHAKLLNSLNSSYSEIRSQLKELRNRLGEAETGTGRSYREDVRNTATGKGTIESLRETWSSLLEQGTSRLTAFALALTVVGVLGFVLYYGGLLPGVSSDESGPQSSVLDIIRKYKMPWESSHEAVTTREADAGENRQSPGPDSKNELNAGMRKPIIKPSPEPMAQEPKPGTETTPEGSPTPDTGKEEAAPPEKLTELESGTEMPNKEPEPQQRPQKDHAMAILAERPLLQTRSVLWSQLSREPANGVANTSQAPEAQAAETEREADPPPMAPPPSDPSKTVSTARFSEDPPMPAETASIRQEQSHSLEIEAVQACWVQLTFDKKKIETFTLQPGAKREWEVAKEVEIVLGNPAGVQLKWDRKVINVVGKQGQRTHLRLPNTVVAGKSS